MRHLLLLSTVLAAMSGTAGAQEWEQFLEEDGVKGYARSVPGSKILEVRSTLVLPARIEVVGAVLRDVESLARPGSSCTEARFVERPDRNHYTFYAAYDMPWPLSDRDVVIQVSNRYDLARGRVVATLRATQHPRIPPRHGYLRITNLVAEFVVEYLSRERTGVIYTSRTDPGGLVPAWLVNRGNKSTLRSSAFDLRRAVKKPEYVQAAASSPDAALAARLSGDTARMARVIESRLGEFIRDRELIAMLLADPSVRASLLESGGEVGEILLHGWGSWPSRRQAVAVLLRRLLSSKTRDRATIDQLAADTSLLDRILRGQRGAAEVAAFISRLGQRGRLLSP